MERTLDLRFDLMANQISHGEINQLKDIFYLDIALEAYARQLTEKVMHIDMMFIEYMNEISMILNHLCMSYQWIELQYCLNDWNTIVIPLAQDLNEDNARKIKSVIDRLKVALGEVNDSYMQLMQQKA